MSLKRLSHWMRSAAGLLRFRISTLLLLMTVLAILLAWRRDHLALVAQIEFMQNPGPHWGVHEATGPPNTSGYGDIPTAWASKNPDDQPEWLLLEFPAEVTPRSICIYETHSPGAVVKITRVGLLGEEILWQGVDPTPTTAAGGVSKIAVSTRKPTSRIKIYLDSPAVPGWNEIDAVGLVDAKGEVTWAGKASASSSYGPSGSVYGPTGSPYVFGVRTYDASDFVIPIPAERSLP